MVGTSFSSGRSIWPSEVIDRFERSETVKSETLEKGETKIVVVERASSHPSALAIRSRTSTITKFSLDSTDHPSPPIHAADSIKTRSLFTGLWARRPEGDRAGIFIAVKRSGREK
jgi:hypothetical protein